MLDLEPESAHALSGLPEDAVAHEKFLKYKQGKSKEVDNSVLNNIVEEIVEKDIFGR